MHGNSGIGGKVSGFTLGGDQSSSTAFPLWDDVGEERELVFAGVNVLEVAEPPLTC